MVEEGGKMSADEMVSIGRSELKDALLMAGKIARIFALNDAQKAVYTAYGTMEKGTAAIQKLMDADKEHNSAALARKGGV